MSITTLPRFHVPPMIDSANNLVSLIGTSMNASGDKLAFVFPCPKAGTLDKFEFRTSVVTNNPDNGIRLSFQTVSLATGSADGVQDQFRDITGTLAANTWQVPGLMTSDGTDTGTKRTVAAGELLACVIEFVTFVASDQFSISTITNANIPRNVYIDDASTGTYVKSAGDSPLLALKYADGTYAEFDLPLWPIMAVTNTAFNSGTTPDERALRFQVPVSMRLVGFYVGGDFDNPVDLVLYDSAGSVLDTFSFDPDQRSNVNKFYMTGTFAAGPHTLTANTTYRLSVKPTSGSNISAGQFDLPGSAYQACMPGGAQWYLSTRADAGAWTDVQTSRPEIGLIFNGVDTGSAAVPPAFTFVA